MSMNVPFGIMAVLLGVKTSLDPIIAHVLWDLFCFLMGNGVTVSHNKNLLHYFPSFSVMFPVMTWVGGPWSAVCIRIGLEFYCFAFQNMNDWLYPRPSQLRPLRLYIYSWFFIHFYFIVFCYKSLKDKHVNKNIIMIHYHILKTYL